jgi:single-stranded-DNA-specific exonuclease
LRLDAEVGLDEINFAMLAELEKLKPTGQGNPVVQFCARNLSHAKPLQKMGANKQHVKMWVSDGNVMLEAVWWNGGEKNLPVGKFDLAFAPQINEFNGRSSVQLKVLDWRPAS